MLLIMLLLAFYLVMILVSKAGDAGGDSSSTVDAWPLDSAYTSPPSISHDHSMDHDF